MNPYPDGNLMLGPRLTQRQFRRRMLRRHIAALEAGPVSEESLLLAMAAHEINEVAEGVFAKNRFSADLDLPQPTIDELLRRSWRVRIVPVRGEDEYAHEIINDQGVALAEARGVPPHRDFAVVAVAKARQAHPETH